MKSKKLTFSLNLIIILALAFGLLLQCVLVNGADVAYAADSYYASVTATSGKALLGQLHDLIVSTHTYYTSYSDVKQLSVHSDPGKGNNTVLEFYTHIDISNSNFDKSGGWNREHVWAQSISNGLWGTSGAGSDLHHIRPAEKDLNANRGNKRYGEVSGGKSEYTSVSKVLGGYSDSGTFEPLDNVKGDVARIVMYVYTHYNSAGNVGGTTDKNNKTYGNLPVTKVISASSESAAWQMLLKWNKLDPVDEIERTRNDYVYTQQHNRNPFIDNENYADAIWGDGTLEKVDLENLTITPNNVNLAVGASQTLQVTPTPSNANAKVTWSSSNNDVAAVNADGVVTAKSGGSATITAVSVENASIKATANVTVKTIAAIELIGSPNTTAYQAGQQFDPYGLTVKATYDDGSTENFTSKDDLKRFQWVGAVNNQASLTADTAIVCKYGDIEVRSTWTVTVTEPPEHISEFVADVAAISSAATLRDRFNAINTALSSYGQLTAAEKQNVGAQGAYQTLRQAIAEYNANVENNNTVMQNATKTGARAICGVTLAAAALITVLNRKFN